MASMASGARSMHSSNETIIILLRKHDKPVCAAWQSHAAQMRFFD
jgi:hypothetical protein